MPRLSGLRLAQPHTSDQLGGGDSGSEWSSDPPSPMSLTSSLLELSPLSSFSFSDLDCIPDQQLPAVKRKKPATPEAHPPACIKIERSWSCNRCGSSIFPPSTTADHYLLSIPMPYSTRSSGLPAQPPTAQPPKPGPNRKRKATEPASAAEPDHPLAPSPVAGATPPPPANKAKRKKTTISALPTGAVAPPDNPSPDPPALPQDPKASATTSNPQGSERVAVDPPAVEQSPITAEPLPTMGPQSAEDQVDPLTRSPNPEAPASAPGDNTRNRNQRPPNLRDENAVLAKANAELEARIKQMTSDIRTLKKFKVLWIKEHSKQSSAVGSISSESLIPRPPGEKGKNGWNLQEAMGLKENEPLYSEILRSVRHCISQSGLDWDSTFSEQEPGRIAACFKELKKLHPYLERFQGDWPAKEMVISALQNRRKAQNAKAKAKIAADGKAQADLAAAAELVDSGNID